MTGTGTAARSSTVDPQDYTDWLQARTGQDHSRFLHRWLMSDTTPAL